MKKKSRQRQQVKRALKLVSSTALIAPLALSGATVIDVSAKQNVFENWILQKIGGSLEVGDSVTVDLADFFENSHEASFIVVNHNQQIAVVSITDGILTLNGKKVGSTSVELLIEHAEEGPGNERFSLAVVPAEGLEDVDEDGLRIDDIVRYIHTHSHKSLRRENITYLLDYIATTIQVHNRPPEASEELHHLYVSPGEPTLIDLRDFFFDPDGDPLEYNVEHDSDIAQIMADEHMVSITATGPIGSTSEMLVTAHDGQPESSEASKTIILNIVAGDDYSPPELINPIPDLVVPEGTSFHYVVPEDTFRTGSDDEPLTYTATLANGDPLPYWMQFDALGVAFSGVTAEWDEANPAANILNIRVTVTGSSGASTSATFQLTIEEVDNAPIASVEEIDFSLKEEQRLELQLSELFTSDSGEFRVISVDGEDSWDSDTHIVEFYPSTETLVFIPSGSFVEPESVMTLKFQAEDIEHEELSSIVSVSVAFEPKASEPLTVVAGSQVSVSELTENYFVPYRVDGEPSTFYYSLDEEYLAYWAELDPDDMDTLSIYPDAEGEKTIRVTAIGMNGTISIEQNFTVVITFDGDDGG